MRTPLQTSTTHGCHAIGCRPWVTAATEPVGSLPWSRCLPETVVVAGTEPVTRQSALDMLAVAVEEARTGLEEGGIPIGAALFDRSGQLLGRGHNRRVQDADASTHAETSAFRSAGRRRNYRETVMVTTLSPCWYCSGLVRQFGIGAVVIGESTNFTGGHQWLAGLGVQIVLLDDPGCVKMLATFITERPELWFEDIGL